MATDAVKCKRSSAGEAGKFSLLADAADEERVTLTFVQVRHEVADARYAARPSA